MTPIQSTKWTCRSCRRLVPSGLFARVRPGETRVSFSRHCDPCRAARWAKRAMPDANPTGLCACGCGSTTPIANKTHRSRGVVKGQHLRYCVGHHGPFRERALIEPPVARSAWFTRYSVDPASGCWVWMGSRNAGGYGNLRLNGRTVAAHRAFYERYRGPIPTGMQIDHLCRNPSCVNPDHLDPVTPAENVRRGTVPKLSPDRVRVIRAARGAVKDAVLARQFGVTTALIRAVRQNKVWRDV